MGMISRRKLFLSYTIQQVIPNICTKFQNPMSSSSWEIFDEKKVYTQTPSHTHERCYWKDKNYIPPLYQGYKNPRFSSSSWEIFDEKKSLHTTPPPPPHTHTQTLLLKRQKLYTPYILRIPGV